MKKLNQIISSAGLDGVFERNATVAGHLVNRFCRQRGLAIVVREKIHAKLIPPAVEDEARRMNVRIIVYDPLEIAWNPTRVKVDIQRELSMRPYFPTGQNPIPGAGIAEYKPMPSGMSNPSAPVHRRDAETNAASIAGAHVRTPPASAPAISKNQDRLPRSPKRQKWFYAYWIRNGGSGTVPTWPECERIVHKKPDSYFKKFRKEAQAQAWIEETARKRGAPLGSRSPHGPCYAFRLPDGRFDIVSTRAQLEIQILGYDEAQWQECPSQEAAVSWLAKLESRKAPWFRE